MSWPTSYPAVNALGAALLERVQTILGEDLVGVYLHGSLASGEYVERRSDVDFLVVTERPPTEEQADRLGAMHREMAAGRADPVPMIEVSYIHRRALQRFDPTDNEHWALSVEGEFSRRRHGINWIINRDVVQRQGITLAGAPPDTLIDPITRREVVEAAIEGTVSWWPRTLDEPDMLPGPEYIVFAALTMARALHTAETGDPVGKDLSAVWMSEHYPEWADLLQEARKWRYGDDFERRQETMKLVRFTLGLLGWEPAEG